MTSKLDVWFRLGRVSNLPTIWSNVLAAAALATSHTSWLPRAWLMLGMSLAYTGGMLLNDAFDRHIDAKERPSRPIPMGLVSAKAVFGAGFALLCASVLCNGAASVFRFFTTRAEQTLAGQTLAQLSFGNFDYRALIAAVLLCITIVAYDAFHKNNPLSPVLMAACRALVYVTVGIALSGTVSSPLAIAACALSSHLIGLTYAAKQEALNRLGQAWPLLVLAGGPILCAVYFSSPYFSDADFSNAGAAGWLALLLFAGWVVRCLLWLFHGQRRSVGNAVVGLIAGISLLDGYFCIAASAYTSALACFACFFLTRAAQRVIPGT